MAKFMLASRNEALTGAAVKTCVQYVGASGRRARVRAWGFSLDGVTAANVPGDVDLLRQTTAGTASAGTLVDWDDNTATAAGTAQVTFTVEPTAGNILHPEQVTPNGGSIAYWYGDDGPQIAGTGRIGIRGLFANSVNATAWMIIEEL